MQSKQIVVLGLGVFGSTVTKTLSQFGCEVVAVDKCPECVQRVSEFATKAVIGDITDKQFLVDLGLEEFDVGIVAIGNHLEESLLGVLNLKEIGIPYIIANDYLCRHYDCPDISGQFYRQHCPQKTQTGWERHERIQRSP